MLCAHACTVIAGSRYLKLLPPNFSPQNSTWAWLTYETPEFRSLPWHFNRTAFQAPWDTQASEDSLNALNAQLNETEFIAYDEAFFDLIGPGVSLEHVQEMSQINHEGPCLTPNGELFFTEWGPPGGDNGVHTLQYLLDTRTNTLRNIMTTPPLINHHGCHARDGKLYVVNDGGVAGNLDAPAELAVIDPQTWVKTSLLNHYYEQPFGALNDIAMDPEGNFYFTDSKSGYGKAVTPYAPPTRPQTYFINGTTLRPKVLHGTDPSTGNTNGVTISPDGKTIYMQETGVSGSRPTRLDPYAQRSLYSYDFSVSKKTGKKLPVLENKRLLNEPLAWYYDGIHASKEGYLFVGARETVDVIDPETGLTIGSIRMKAPNLAVNLVFEKNGIWIVGVGGVFHVSNVAADL
ncbi:AkeP protein, partial [Pseudovirgaria hyperparasitica]